MIRYAVVVPAMNEIAFAVVWSRPARFISATSRPKSTTADSTPVMTNRISWVWSPSRALASDG